MIAPLRLLIYNDPSSQASMMRVSVTIPDQEEVEQEQGEEVMQQDQVVAEEEAAEQDFIEETKVVEEEAAVEWEADTPEEEEEKEESKGEERKDKPQEEVEQQHALEAAEVLEAGATKNDPSTAAAAARIGNEERQVEMVVEWSGEARMDLAPPSGSQSRRVRPQNSDPDEPPWNKIATVAALDATTW